MKEYKKTHKKSINTNNSPVKLNQIKENHIHRKENIIYRIKTE